MADFKSGDVVQLKSGGPVLTVVEPITKNGKVRCYYFSADALKDVYLEPETLRVLPT